uniref:Uncharacterized protein n=2 Tax=Biomphalaria glabrata TaxID=6526 RepID=A0A2C9LT90_BIOGL
MIRCNELWLLFTLLTSLLLGMQADDKTDKYEYDGKTVVPKDVTGCQDGKTGIMLKTIRILKQSKEIALLPHGIETDIGQLDQWIDFANRCNGKSQCQMNQMKFLNSVADRVHISSANKTTIEIDYNCKPTGGDNVYRIDRNFNKVGSTSVYLLYNETSENKVVCHVTADGTTKIEILHFEWIPTSDCLNSNDNISLSSQEFNCSWTNANKAVTVPNPKHFPIQFLKQTGFVWLEVQTEVAESRNTTLNLTCDFGKYIFLITTNS